MIEIKIYNEVNKPTAEYRIELVDFLFKHLEEFGDPKGDIQKSINYALKDTESFGGYILVAQDREQIVGVVVVNQTGMKDYIPENILVYIATHNQFRGKGIGKQLMSKAIEIAEGNVALHVEPHNPAKFLYEKVGFKSKYIEMRYIK